MNYTKILRWGILGGLCLVLCVPFIVTDGQHAPLNLFFPFITGKNFAFRILIEVLVALYVLLALREPKFRPRSSLLMWALGTFVVWMALATITSVDPVKSFWSNFERMDGYITLLHMFGLFVVAGAVLTAEDWWYRFMRTSVGASVVMGLYAVMQAFGYAQISSQSGQRVDTTFGNATYLAVYMLFNIFITLFLLIRERRSIAARWLYGIALALQLVTLYYTQTRGALLGFLGGLVLAALYTAVFARGTEWKAFRTYAFWGLGAIVLIIVGFLAVKNTSFVKNSETLSRFASISLTDRTTQSRFLIWGEALKGVQEKPLLGWGQENFSFVFNKYYNPLMYDQEQWFDRAHNEFIDWAVAGGIPAFLMYLSLFLLAAWALWRSELEVPEQAMLMGALAGYAFNNLFVFDNLASLIYFMLLLAFAHSVSRTKLPSHMFMSKPLGDHAIAIAAPVVAIVLVFGIWSLNGAGLARAQNLITALTSTNLTTGAPKTPAENLAAFKEVVNSHPLGFQEAAEQLFQYATGIAGSSDVAPDVKQDIVNLTVQTGDTLLKNRPGDARLELFYGVFLAQYGQFDKAIDHLQSAIKDSPKKQQIYFQLGTTYLAKGDIASALPLFKQAYEFAPAYSLSRVMYASALYYAGQAQQADALLTEGFGTVYVDDARLIQVMFSLKRFDRLVGIYDVKIKKNPKDVQALVGHAVSLYFATGDKAAAIAELNAAAQVDPTLAAQVQSFVKQIQDGTLKP